jgi:acetyl esterase/lipase
MKKFRLFLIISILSVTGFQNLFSQPYCIPGRFDTNYVFSPLQIDTIGATIYGRNKTFLGDSVNLKFIMAYPKFSADPLTKRPLVVLIHGGGFMSGDMYEMQPVMLDMAMRGYVCASIDYRTGWNIGPDPLHCTGNYYSMVQAIYRAMQDTKAAFRFFASRANTYRIDTAYMFSAGISAGAVVSQLIPYMTQADINALYPKLVTELGRLDFSSNRLRNSFKIKCVLSASGGMFDTSYMKPANTIPTLMFHGTMDSIVPYMTGFAYMCPNYVRTQGSGEITKRFRTLGKAFELDYVPGGGHENFYPLEYIQLRSIMFLKRYLCGNMRQVIIENFTTILDSSINTLTPIVNENENNAENFVLFQNYPNPFNPTTKIQFQIPNSSVIARSGATWQSQSVSLKVYDILGKEITTLLNKELTPGNYEITFDGSNLTSGIYFYKLQAGDFVQTKRMTLIK